MAKSFDIAFKLGAELTSSFKGAFAEASKSMKGLEEAGKRMKSIGKTMTATVTAPIVGMGAAAVMVGANFEAGMSKVAAVSGAAGADLVALTEKARELGAKTQFSATEAADALNYMAMSGWDTTQMLGGIDGVLSLAAASGEDLAMVSDIVTDSLTAFGMKAEDSARFADVLAGASANANTNVSMLGESFKYVAPLAGALGYSAEDTTKALSLMANAGIKGSQSGTALKTMLANLASPTKKMKGSMDALGISLTNSDGTMKTLDEVMLNLRGSFDGLTEVQQASAASTIFGKEAMAGALAVINASTDDYDKLSDAINNSEGAAERMAAVVNDNLMGRVKEMQSALEEAGISIYYNLQPALEAGVAAITKLADWFNNLSPAGQNTVVVIAGVVAAIGPLLMITGMFITQTVTVIRAVKTVNKVYKDMMLVQRAAQRVMNTFRASVLAFNLSTGGLRASLAALSTSFRALTVSMLANPIVWVAVAVVALGAAFFIAYKRSETFRNGVNNAFSTMLSGVLDASTWIANLAVRMWDGLISGVAGIGDKFKSVLNSEIIGAFSGLAERVKENFMQSISTIPGIISRVAPMLATMGLGALGITGPVGLVIGAIISLVAFLYRLSQTNEEVAGAFKAIWDTVSSAMAPIVDVITAGFAEFMDEVGPEFAKTAEVIKESFVALGPPLQEVGKSFAELGELVGVMVLQLFSELGSVISEVAVVFVSVGTVVFEVFGLMATVIAKLIPIIMQIIVTVLPVLLQVFTTVLTTVLGVVMAVIPIVLELFTSVVTVILDLVMAVLPMILMVIQTVFPIILGIIQEVLPIFIGLLTTVVSVILSLAQMVIPLLLMVIQTVLPIVLTIVQAIIPIIAAVFQVLIAVINGVLIPAINAILAVVQFVFPFIQVVIETALAIINGIIQAAMALLQGDWSGAWEIIKETASTIMNNIIDFFSGINLYEVGKSIITGLIDGIKSMGSAVVGAISSIVPAPLRAAVSSVVGAIPGFAKGGIVDAPTLAWVGEGGDTETVIPWNNSQRSRDLWMRTGQELGLLGGGAFGDTTQDSPSDFDVDFSGSNSKPPGSSGASYTIHNNPTYIIEGGDPEEAKRAVEDGNDDLLEKMKEIKKDEDRRRLE